jgi:hypothetical protein
MILTLGGVLEMKLIKVLAVSLLAAPSFMALMAATATPASAQATRTWVSGVGDDVNPCSRTAPCKTFAGAISKTATAGEINCLDPGGFGGVTITKSLAIVCDYTEGGVLSAGAGVNGIVINMPATSSVFLSGLDLNGAGSAQNGIRIISGGDVVIQNSIIRNYRASNGLGLSVQPSLGLNLTVVNTTIAQNGTGATGGGVLLQPTGSGNVHATFRDVRILDHTNNGFRVDTTGNTGAGIIFAMENVQITGNANGISLNAAPATTGIIGMINGASINRNTGTGIGVTGGPVAVIRVANSTITDNGTGVSPGTATINSFGDNRLIGNTSNGAFTGAIVGTL